MDENTIKQEIDAINKKLDIVLEEIEHQKKHRREIEDLKDDLMRVGKDLYQTTVTELDEFHDQIQTGDILHLFKKLLRNVNNITKTFEMLESTKDFLKDFAPISKELITDLMNKLDELDQKRFFIFLNELSKISEKLVSSLSIEDLKNLNDNIVNIVQTVKNLTQPEMLAALNSTLEVYKNFEMETPAKVSLISLLKELNSPEVKRSLYSTIQFLKKLSEKSSDKKIHNQQ